MLEQFWATIRVAWVAGQISARHRLERPYALAYHHPLAETLFNTLKTESSGVFVHWGVYESGKSTASREVAWRLQEQAGKQVICLHGFDFSHLHPVCARMRRAIGVPVDMEDRQFSDFFSKPNTTIVIDHFDILMCDKNNRGDETLEWVIKLIEESERTKKFNVLLVVNSWEQAQELVDAGCKLLPGDAPARWTRGQLETLYASLSDKVKSTMSGKEDELLRLATLSGTPGFLTFAAHGERISPKYAAMHDLEWRRGMKGLYKQTHLDLSPHVEIGRFPDRNGVYHHEDLQEFHAQRLHI
jgi:hypothetical protein